MDFIFALVVKLLLAELFPLIISYDTACQWFIKLFQQMGAWPECLQIPKHVHVHAIILKLQFQSHHDKNHAQHCLHWMLGVGQCDCKGLEKIWAGHNALGNSTKSQGPGTHHNKLDFHFVFWNWLKYIVMGM